jgi:diguanylate cyclase (GGDEF)-like protein/PAS domain S-box-containing protein
MDDLSKSKEQLIQENKFLRQQQSRLEETGQMWDAMLSSTPDLVYFKDAQHGLKACSQTYADAVGVEDPASLIGKTALDLWPEEGQEIMADEKNVLAGQPMVRKERLVTTSDGSERWFLLTKIPIYQGGNIIGFFAMDKDITERKIAEQSLRESENRFRQIFDSNMIGISFWDQEGKITRANDAYLSMIGYSEQDVQAGRVHWPDLTPSEFQALDELATLKIQTSGSCIPYEKEYIHKDGSRIPVLIGGASLPGENHFGITFAVDISDRKMAERQNIERWMYLESVLNAAPDAIVTLDARQRIVEWNPGARQLFGYTAEETIGKQLDDLITRPEINDEAVNYTNQVQEGKAIPPTEVVRYRKDGSQVEVILAGSPIMMEGELIGAIGVYTDISDRVRMENELRAMALRDSLTGLYNRRGFSILAEQQLKIAAREKHNMLLLYVDLDELKTINDSFGHPEGDQALQIVGRTLQETFRKSDLIARIGGDEFVVLALESKSSSAETLLKRLKENLEINNMQNNLRFQIAVSVGCVQFDPGNPCTLIELLDQADQSMYEHKLK